MQKKFITKEQALQKLQQYCAYQERCHFEVKQKLWELGIIRSYHDEIIAILIQDDYLNEERFAVQYAGGKFRIKKWGRKKILYALKEKMISSYCITKALATIEEGDYIKTLQNLADKKYRLLKKEQYLIRKNKTINYLLQKGYEGDLIITIMKELISK